MSTEDSLVNIRRGVQYIPVYWRYRLVKLEVRGPWKVQWCGAGTKGKAGQALE